MRFTRTVGTQGGIRRIPGSGGRPWTRRPLSTERPRPAGPAARPERKHLSPRSYLAVSLLFSAVVFGLFLVSERGFLQVRRQRAETARMQAEVSALDAENRRLEAEVAAMTNDPKAVEKIAREKLGLVKPGDVVLVLPEGWRTRVRPPPQRTAPQTASVPPQSR